MCNDHELPPLVARTLDAYRAVVAEKGANWGESTRSLYGPLVPYLRFVRHTELLAGPVAAALAEGRSPTEAVDGAVEGDLDAAFRDALRGRVPDGVVVLRLTRRGRGSWARGTSSRSCAERRWSTCCWWSRRWTPRCRCSPSAP